MAHIPRFNSCVNKINHTCCRCFDKETTFYRSNEVFFERQSLEYTFKTRRSEIACFVTLYNEQPYPDGALPHWLNLECDSDTRSYKISTDYVPDLAGIDSIKIFAFDRDGYKLEEVTFKNETTSEDQNFSRPCKTSEKIKKFKFFNADKTSVPQPSWFQYNRISNRIIAEGFLSLKEIEPLTVLILGQNDEVLETIYINKLPKEKPFIVTDESEEEEDAPLLAERESRVESKSPPSSIEMAKHKNEFSEAASPSTSNTFDKGKETDYTNLD